MGMSQKNVMLFSHTGCLFFNLMALLCYWYDISIGVLISLIGFTFMFQSGLGPIPHTHAMETCHARALGMVNVSMYSCILTFSSIGVVIIRYLGSEAVFAFWSALGFILLFYLIFVMKNTTYRIATTEPTSTPDEPGVPSKSETPKKVRVPLSFNEKQELYWPTEFKTIFY